MNLARWSSSEMDAACVVALLDRDDQVLFNRRTWLQQFHEPRMWTSPGPGIVPLGRSRPAAR